MRLRSRVGRLLVGLSAGLGALVVLTLLFEERLIYFPSRDIERGPGELGLRFEEGLLRAEDGVRIQAWFLPVEASCFTVLCCHGNGGNISHRLDRVLFMQAKLRTDVLLFDYRGYGKSEGRPDEEGTYRDGRAAYTYLVRECGLAPDRIILFGESLGAAIAVQMATELQVRALVLESPFTSIRDMARAVYPFLPVGSLLRTRYDNLAKIQEVTVPLLVLHGTHDRTVPFAQGKRLFEAAREPKRFFGIEGAGHNDTFYAGGEAYWEVWRRFLDSL